MRNRLSLVLALATLLTLPALAPLCAEPGSWTEAPEVPGRQAADEGELVAQLRDEDGDRLSTRRRHPGESRRRPDAHEPNRVLEGRGEVGHSLGCRGANLT